MMKTYKTGMKEGIYYTCQWLLHNINKIIDSDIADNSIEILEFIHDKVHEHCNEGLKDAINALDQTLNLQLGSKQ